MRRVVALLSLALILAAPGYSRSARELLRTQDQHHVVQPGENLYRIALQYGVDLKDLCEMNRIGDPSALEVGQRLILPRKKQTRVGIYHEVRQAETLEQIAQAYGTNDRALARVNRMRTDNRLRSGMLIWIPEAKERREVKGASARPAATASPAPDRRPTSPSRKSIEEAARAAAQWRGTTVHKNTTPPPPTAAPSPARNTASAPPRMSGTYHRVASGESLKRIGERYGITNWEWLAEVNRLSNPNSLEVGQRVFIPSVASRPALASVDTKAQPQTAQARSSTFFSTEGLFLTRENDDPPPPSEHFSMVAAPMPPPRRAVVPEETLPVRVSNTPLAFGWPLSLRAVRTVPFGVERGKSFHRGVDLAASEGTPILAAEDGVVDLVGSERDSLGKSLGNHVILSHGIYEYRTCRTIYAHASEVLVRPGQQVRRGQVIARVGNTGRAHGSQGGYHLHFELWYGDDCVDPWPMIERTRPSRDGALVQAK